MFELIRKERFEVSKEITCLLNRIVARNENYDNLGDFRKFPIKIIGTIHKVTAVDDFGIKFKEIIDRYKGNEIENKAFDLFLDIAKTQFFGDGNKRTDRKT